MKKIFKITLFVLSVFLLAGIGIGVYWFFQQQRKLTQKQEMTVAFLDIGQGDATFITFPNGQQMLVDCAIDARILEALGRVVPFHDFTIDYLVVTHPDLDHYGGCVDVMKRFDVAHTIFNGYQKETVDYFDVFQDTIQHEGAYHEITEEESLDIASTTVHFLYPDHSIRQDPRIPGSKTETESNNTSIVIKLSYGEQDVLLTGDTEEPLEKYLVEKHGESVHVEVLKVGHHGSDSSSSREFLQAVSPQHVTISVGAENRYGHPSNRVLKRLQRIGAHVWRTDQVGDIIAHITPNAVYVEGRQEK